MLYFKSCPKCHGDVHVDEDSYGAYAKCLQCGFSRDLPSIAALEKALAGVSANAPAARPAAHKKAA